MKILIMTIMMLLTASLVYLSYRLEQRRKKYINGIRKFSEENRRFDGVVTSTAKDSVMLKFRDEEQKKTIHHKYTFSKKRYRSDTAVVLFYDEQNDSVCVEGDNPFVYNAMRCAAGSAVCVAAAIALLVSGIIIVL